MRPLLRAIRLFQKEPRLWRYALRPMAWGVLAYGLVILLLATTFATVAHLFAGWFGLRGGATEALGGLLGLMIAILCAGPIYLGLVGLIAGLGFDRLSIEVEEMTFGSAAGPPPSTTSALADGMLRMLLAGALGLVALCGAGTFVIPWLVASFLALLDFTACACLRRGVRIESQFGRVRKLRDAGAFGLIAGGIGLIPIVNIAMLPILVTAGTILVAGSDRSN